MAKVKTTPPPVPFTATVARQIALETGKTQVDQILNKIEKAARVGDLNITVDASLVTQVVRETLQNQPYSYKVAGVQKNGHNAWNTPPAKETVLIQW